LLFQGYFERIGVSINSLWGLINSYFISLTLILSYKSLWNQGFLRDMLIPASNLYQALDISEYVIIPQFYFSNWFRTSYVLVFFLIWKVKSKRKGDTQSTQRRARFRQLNWSLSLDIKVINVISDSYKLQKNKNRQQTNYMNILNFRSKCSFWLKCKQCFM
jgi:hypothetical protein